MSNFDKLVANWVSSAGSRPREEREEILSRISKNLETYRELENPSEVYARKQAEKKRLEEEKKKAEAEQKKREEERKRKLEEERQKELEARRASLPPLPPSTKAQGKAPADASGGGSRRGSRPLSLKRTGRSPRNQDAAEEAKPVLSEKERARLNAQRLAVRDVDYKFESDVNAALNKLRAGGDGPLLGSSEKSSTVASPRTKGTGSKAKGGPSSPRGTKRSSAKRDGGLAGTTTTTADSTTPASARTPQEPPATPVVPAPQEGDPSTSPSSHHQETGEDNAAGGAPGSAARAKPPALAMLEQDTADADQFRADEAEEKQAMRLFTFGAQGTTGSGEDDDDEDVPRFNATRAGNGEDEDKPIPDDEDAMRRADQKKRPSRMGISDASINLDEARVADFPPTPKSRDKVRIITKALERHYLFSFLDDSDISKFASIMDLERFGAGKEILIKGESNDTLFLILSGEAEAVVKGAAEGEEESLVLGEGATFGDVGLMYDTRNAMAVSAKTDMQCASLERKTYKMVTSRSMAERRERYTHFVTSVPFFGDLPKEEITRVAEALKAATYQEGETVIALGAEGEWLHFVLEGTLRIIGRDGEEVATVEKGGVVGHLEFLFHHVAVANVVAASPVVKTAKLSRHQFDRLVSTARAPMVKDVEEGESFQYYRATMQSEHAPATVPTPLPPPTQAEVPKEIPGETDTSSA